MNTQLPAHLQNRVSKGLAQALSANLGVGSPPFVSIMGNRLSLIDSAGEEIPVGTYDPKLGPFLDCVIIDALERTSKIYYDKPFDPGASQYEPPACFSDNGVTPSRNAGKPQSSTCADCQWNAWGSKVSAISGKGVKACGDIQKIALLVPGYDMPFLLRVPPNSRTNFRGYVNKFVGQPIDVCDVTTRVSFEPGVIGTLHFDAIGYIDEAAFAQREKLSLAHATDALVGRTDLPREQALPAPVQAPQIEHSVSPASSGQQSAPFVPATSVSPASSGQVAPQPATAASPSRRRRNTAEAAPQAQPMQAPFMPQQPVSQAPNASAAAFGMAQGAAPDPTLQNTLDNLFGKK
jgi:hypothetical protein